jgi:hypothetical protein
LYLIHKVSTSKTIAFLLTTRTPAESTRIMLPILLLPLLPLVTTSFTPAVLPSYYDQLRNSAVAFGGVADAKITDSTLTNLSFSLTPAEALVLTREDVAFHEWCESIGIAINPAVRVITSDNSVAGRGAFAIGDLEEGEIIARIPTAVVFHPDNCAECFPQTAALISKSKRKAGFVRRKHKYFGWIQKRWQKVIRKKQEQHTFYHLDQEQLWQPELTLYALDAVKEGHPWGTWISQWQRDDPTYRLFCLNAKAGDENLIDSVASNLKKSYAPYLDELHIKAALLIRLLRLNEERQVIPLNDDSETSGMYALLGSRAVALDDHVTGVIPFHDMINHSLDQI